MSLDIAKIRKLVAAKVEAGIEKSMLAAKAGMSKQRLQNILAGQAGTNVKLKTVYDLAHALGVNAKELIK